MNSNHRMDPLLLEQTLDCSNTCIFDENFSIYYSNINFHSLLGYEKNELNGRSILQLKNLSEATPTYNFLIQTLERGETWKGELQFHHKKNTPIYLDATIKPIQLDKQPIRYIATFIDIHHRKQLIDNLKRRAHQQGLISILGQISLNNIPINDLLQQTLSVVCGSLNITTGMILEISVNGKKSLIRTAYNSSTVQQGSSVLNIDDDNILGYTLRSDRPIICDDYDNETRFTIPDVFVNENSRSAVCALIGERKYPFGIFVLLTETAKKLNIDEVHFLQSVCNILAEAINRKNMEKALRYEQELSRKYLDVAEVIFIVLDENEKILLANLHAASVLGYSQQDLSGMNFFDTFKSDDIKDSAKKEFHKILMKEKIRYDDTSIHGNISPIINRKNKTRLIKWKSSTLHNEEGDVNGILYAGEDITDLLAHEKEQKHLEKQLSQAQKMEAIGMLAGGIAHDFNNILVSILGFSDLALETLKNDTENQNKIKLHQYLTQIKKSGLKARDIIAQIQSINLQDEAPNKSILLPSLLKGTLKMLRSALPSSIDMQVNIKNEIPAVHLNASKFNQMIMHILTNARNALNGQGTINIDLSLLSLSNKTCCACNSPINNDYVVFSVRDDGPGFAEKTLNELFNNNSDSSGLSLVSKLVHESNGHLMIFNNNSNGSSAAGSTVQILFKISNATKEMDKPKEYIIDISAMHEKHLMIVDDENSVATYMAELFRGAGFKVSVFCDAIEALEEFKRQANEYDLIITDLTMPALTGDLLAIKMLNIRSELPIIICTGQSDTFTQENSDNINIRSLLKKPVDSAELLYTAVSLLTTDK